MLLLDTCALIWLAEDLTALGKAARNAIAENPEELHISAISALEITLLATKKRIRSEEHSLNSSHEIPSRMPSSA